MSGTTPQHQTIFFCPTPRTAGSWEEVVLARGARAGEPAAVALQRMDDVGIVVDDLGKVICFFQDAAKFKARVRAIGFSDKANLDEGQHVGDRVRADEADEGRREAHRRARESGHELKKAPVAHTNELEVRVARVVVAFFVEGDLPIVVGSTRRATVVGYGRGFGAVSLGFFTWGSSL